MKKLYLKFIASILIGSALLIFPANSVSAQIKIGKIDLEGKINRKMNRRIDRNVDRSIDKGMDKVEGGTKKGAKKAVTKDKKKTTAITFVKQDFKAGEKVMWKGGGNKEGEIVGLFDDKAIIKYLQNGKETKTGIVYSKLGKTSGSMRTGFSAGEKVMWKEGKNYLEGNIVGIFEQEALLKYKNEKGEEKFLELPYIKLAKTGN
ncbi:MAG: hypothetical protein IIA88_00370 [Bacteroidetes bacterium]|nr:hypothetical protein [Bacteroidota bacterium]